MSVDNAFASPGDLSGYPSPMVVMPPRYAVCGSGDVLQKIANVREKLGILKAKKKEKVAFKVRSADELNDRIRPLAMEQGLLIYPVSCTGFGSAIDAGKDMPGTLASVCLALRIQAISDASYIDVYGFGLGADTQDKAGGKAGTYAWKAALVQTFLAGGAEDTDDHGTPIPGGVKKVPKGPRVTLDLVKEELAKLKSPADAARFKDVAMMAGKLPPEVNQNDLMDAFAEARVRLGMPARKQPAPSVPAAPAA